MKVPLSWLRDYVPLTLPVPKLVERLTLAGLEVGAVRIVGMPVPEGLRVKADDAGPVWDPSRVVVAQVLSVEKHPNADRLKVVTVDHGRGQMTMVTGAPNVNVGDRGLKVVLGMEGTSYFDGHDKSKGKVVKTLKAGQVRGVTSAAMVMSEYELGISEEGEGIILLDADAPVGMPAAEYLGDVVLELDVTPNMARALSMIGVAREVAALTGETVRLPPHAVQGTGEPVAGKVKVEIEDPKLSARYSAALLKNVRIGAAPSRMQFRLTYAGMRPINNVVDVTNFVMLEWGQPLHAFDYDRLVARAGGKTPVITVRPARRGEVLTTLDKVRRELSPDNLVIADAAGPVALAGVMGGLETEVSDTTTTILLEAANFDFVSIRRTSRQLDLPSEASMRFSKGIHPEVVRPAAERASELMRQHAGAEVCRGLVDVYPAPLAPQLIDLSMAEVRRSLGMQFPREEAVRILRALEFKVEETGAESLRATVPPHRLDVQEGAADLIEDLVRIHGYDRLPATLLADQLPEQRTNRPLVLEERVRDILVDAGLQEVITYALTTPEREQPLGLPESGYVRLKNPISSERVVMRHSVLAGVLDVVAANVRQASLTDVRVFEVGPVYLPQPGEKLPAEPRRLSLVLTGRCWPEFWQEGTAAPAPLDFFDLKGVIEALAGDLHLPDVTYRPSQAPHLHPGRAAEVVIGGKPAGSFGQLHPTGAEAFGLGGRTVLAAELDLESLLAAVPERYTYTAVPRFPAALRDIAVIVDDEVPAERIAAEVRAAGGDLLRDIRLFDVYRGESIPEGKKSLAYALTYQAEDRTLTDKEVDGAHKKIEGRLKHVLKAQIRGKE